ncbi:MAG: hypothetical protein ABH824_01530 [Nanoarchaeota archaeon]|nr:U32 family peptidase [Nanoarchaeota archaeon]MBU1632540.1 U32 family peptidase [Nanoarchaeota archaeon]MBU1875688.1 U32 family peptidase [Nanoarchaeota archaeon]
MKYNGLINSIKFSVPYNGDSEIVDFFIEHKNFINDVYFGLPYNILPSGRIMGFNEKPNNYLQNLHKTLNKLKENKIETSLVINRNCEGEKTFSTEMINEYKEIIKPFIRNKLINNVVLSNPIYYDELKKEFPNLTFSISVNTNINTLYKAKYIDGFGFDIIIIDREINHDKELIKEISKKVSAKIKILVNECCLNECLFRTSHFNLLSHHKENIDYKERIPCVKIYSKEPWRMLKSSFILPRDLYEYEKFVDIFKLAGRSLPTKILKYLLRLYFYREEEGDLLAILSSYGLFTWKNEFVKRNNKIPFLEMSKLPKDFKNFIANCNFNCKECEYCKNIWNSCLTTY